MARMDHPNLVRLYALSMGQNMMLISQFVSHGALLSFLKKHKNSLSAKTMLQFSYQIAFVSHQIEAVLKVVVDTVELQRVQLVQLGLHNVFCHANLSTHEQKQLLMKHQEVRTLSVCPPDNLNQLNRCHRIGLNHMIVLCSLLGNNAIGLHGEKCQHTGS